MQLITVMRLSHGGFVDYYKNVTGQKYVNIWMGKAGTGRS